MRRKEKSCLGKRQEKDGASDEARTRYLHLGKVALYQMSYTRINRCHYTRRGEKVKRKMKKNKKFVYSEIISCVEKRKKPVSERDRKKMERVTRL